MFSFPVEIVLKGRDVATTEQVTVSTPAPSAWDDDAVREVLVGILRAIDRAENPTAADDHVVMLRGFSWIVEPSGKDVVIAIEIPMGAAVAGPFAIPQKDLDAKIARVLAMERQLSGVPNTVH